MNFQIKKKFSDFKMPKKDFEKNIKIFFYFLKVGKNCKILFDTLNYLLNLRDTCPSLTSWMVYASLYEGGLSDFMKNTGRTKQ